MAGGGINKVILIGNLGADPELRYTPSGQPVCDLRVATNESWTDKNGQKQERTEWHRVVFWGKQGEILKQYMSKGRQLYIEGRLQTRSWDDKDGNKKYSTEIIGNNFLFLGGGGASAEAGAPAGRGSFAGGGSGGRYQAGSAGRAPSQGDTGDGGSGNNVGPGPSDEGYSPNGYGGGGGGGGPDDDMPF
ncbi:MAG: single-stranded DNA-binding protein [Pseudomonadota bacterium]